MSSRISWKNLRRNIPNKVRTAVKSFFEVLWIDKMEDSKGRKLYGKTEFEPNRIILNIDQEDKDAVYTSWHEMIHALDHDHEIKLTEAQVIKIEKCFPVIREFILNLEGKLKK